MTDQFKMKDGRPYLVLGSKHTPGPWDIDSIVCDCGRGIGHRIEQESNHRDSSAHHANALLIASAPDLLEALEYLINPVGLFSQTLADKQARAAIAKAKGETE